MPKNPIKVACVGAGYFSQFHYDAWDRIAEAEVVGAMDQEIESARQVCESAYDDFGQMLRQTRPELVDIISPPQTHLDYIRQCVDFKVPTVICQKPFCGDLGSAREAVRCAEESGTELIVHENFRFQPWYRLMKASVKAGDIGKLLQVTFRLRPGDGQGERAYLDRQPYFQSMQKFLIHETGIHWVDVFRFLCGEPVSVYADLRRLNPAIAGEDAGMFILDFGEGVLAQFDGNRLVDHNATNTRRTMGEAIVEGTEGVLTLDGEGRVVLRKMGASETRVLLEPATAEGFGGDCVFHLQRHVCQCLREGKKPENRASEYLRNMVIEEAIYDSAATGKRRVLD